MRRRLVLAAGAFFALAAPARAHAMLERAAPAVGSIQPASPAWISLRFSEPIEAALSRIEVRGGAGEIAVGAAETPDDDRHVLRARLRTILAAGRYSVHWRAVSVDGHMTQGDYVFLVAP